MKPRRFDLNPDNFLAGIAGQLTAVEAGVYLVMVLLHYSHAGPFEYDERRLSSLLAGTHWRTIRAASERLQELGKITSERGHVAVKGCSEPLQEAVKRVSRAVQNGSMGGRPPNKNNDITKPDGCFPEKLTRAPAGVLPLPLPLPPPEKGDSDKSESLAQTASRRLSEFQEFWTQYPRKVGKRTARKAFDRAVQRSAPATIIEATKRYAASRAGEDESFTCHASTWLNRDGWLDAVTTANGSSSPSLFVGLSPELEERERLERARKGINVH